MSAKKLTKKTKRLTKEEAEWVQQLQALLNSCPSERIGAYTTGDHTINLYDRTFEADINAVMDDSRGNKDFCQAVEQLGCELGALNTPFAVHATAG